MLNEYGAILSLEDLCNVLKISESAGYALLRTGKIKSFKVGRIHKIPNKELEAYIVRECHNHC